MSPITREARDRIMQYLKEHNPPNTPPAYEPGPIRRMLDDLIACVRGERDEDNPF